MKNKIYIIIICINLMLIFFTKSERIPIENMAIPSGVGFDIDKNGNYNVAVNNYIFREEGETLSIVNKGIGNSMGKTRENRQIKQDKVYVVGQERGIVIGEKAAYKGIRKIIDLIFRNPLVNDKAYMVVYDGVASEILQYKIKNYVSAAEFIEELINKISSQNFYPDDVKIIDVYVRLDSEGRNVILPYLKKEEGKLKVSGLAVFKKDKMVLKINKNESKLLNILRPNSGRGIITVKKGNKYMDLYGKVKRKVKCSKENNKYKFDIDLQFKGNVVSNELYENLDEDYDVVKEAEEEAAKIMEKKLNDFIKKVKNNYKIDCFELGRVAAATFGRNKEEDWDEIIANSEINVNVKVKIGSHGRGEY
ncbi:Ger(x)C family spore germination protein [Clostridium ganghwense]|uniref:Ger(X)C family spore germination protein n=1 Tax=Clostridium ganghwense TaxID=312089 RepID=A0ABT4CRL5_9CLOT|nr:Ger(x)C family spore germination protein [Clostridium ganghwense]MCY6371705.1 Ger(x)C family spore germination protein [Clostridium ganghwense]